MTYIWRIIKLKIMEIVGRIKEIKLLQSLYEDRESSFLAVYGRRRVGKTYLIRQVYKKDILFECSGLHKKSMSKQLEHFWLQLNTVNPTNPPIEMPKTWLQAIFQLRAYLDSLAENDPKKSFFSMKSLGLKRHAQVF